MGNQRFFHLLSIYSLFTTSLIALHGSSLRKPNIFMCYIIFDEIWNMFVQYIDLSRITNLLKVIVHMLLYCTLFDIPWSWDHYLAFKDNKCLPYIEISCGKYIPQEKKKKKERKKRKLTHAWSLTRLAQPNCRFTASIVSYLT